MASVILYPSGDFIDYSLVDGRIREFVHNDMTVYDENENDNVMAEWENWKDVLAKICEKAGLNINDGRGYHAFIYKLAEEGKLELK